AIIIVIQYGVARGMFSNESGLGSAAIAAAAAQTSHPVRQGLVSMTQTFIDTIIVVSFTGLVIITTGTWSQVDPETGAQLPAALMTGEAFSYGLPGQWGHWVVTIGLVLFAFSTLLAWSYYGERNIERLFGRWRVLRFSVCFSLVVFIGASADVNRNWLCWGIFGGLMGLPCLIGLLVRSGLIACEAEHYLKRDPKWEGPAEEIEAFIADPPGW